MNKIIEAVNELELVKRIHSLEEKIDSNNDVTNLFQKLKDKQKQMVNAKEFEQWNQYSIYKKEYDELYEALLDYPFIEEYIDLLNQANEIIGNISLIIEKKINYGI